MKSAAVASCLLFQHKIYALSLTFAISSFFFPPSPPPPSPFPFRFHEIIGNAIATLNDTADYSFPLSFLATM